MLDKEELIAFEREVADLWEAGKIDCPVHLSGGNEDQLIEIFKNIEESDYVFSGHRNHYHALLHGVDSYGLLSEILNQEGATCHGRARSMGFIDHNRHFYSSAIVGGMCAPAVGAAWALKAKYSNQRVWCFVGDGVLDGGYFWESVNYAEGWDLPIIFVVEDNDRATKTSIKARMGPTPLGLREIIKGHPKIRWYSYEPTWPHVGSGTYVQF